VAPDETARSRQQDKSRDTQQNPRRVIRRKEILVDLVPQAGRFGRKLTIPTCGSFIELSAARQPLSSGHPLPTRA
jgi:hypothetical protein